MQGIAWIAEELLAFASCVYLFKDFGTPWMRFGAVCFGTFASLYGHWESEADRILTSYVALQTVLSEVTVYIACGKLPEDGKIIAPKRVTAV